MPLPLESYPKKTEDKTLKFFLSFKSQINKNTKIQLKEQITTLKLKAKYIIINGNIF